VKSQMRVTYNVIYFIIFLKFPNIITKEPKLLLSARTIFCIKYCLLSIVKRFVIGVS